MEHLENTSTQVVITANDLGKQFRINEYQVRKFAALRHKIDSTVQYFLRSLQKKWKGNHSSNNLPKNKLIWGLKNVSFKIKKGEIVGILGPNGAGKSILLKILSRITKPTTGYAEISGKVASFLEVDTGFHGDLTGRENIFMSGTIIGLSQKHIKENISEIIKISELEKFIDTPVKRYSSGMRVKLAFAIVSQLRPDILILDEILAVADERFKQKCLLHLKKMAATKEHTILIVSHDLNMIQQLCNRVLVIDKGQLIGDYDSSIFKSNTFNYLTISRETIPNI